MKRRQRLRERSAESSASANASQRRSRKRSSKRGFKVRSGDLRLVAVVLATIAFAVLLNQPGRQPSEPMWTDALVLRPKVETAVAPNASNSGVQFRPLSQTPIGKFTRPGQTERALPEALPPADGRIAVRWPWPR